MLLIYDVIHRIIISESKNNGSVGELQLPYTCAGVTPPTQRIYIRTAGSLYPFLPFVARGQIPACVSIPSVTV